MLKRYFEKKEHVILFGSTAVGADVGMLLFENAINYPELGRGKISKYRSFMRLFSEAEHIVFHQFYPNLSLMLLLFFHKKFLDKAIWVIWGIDLYNYKYRDPKIKEKILNYLGYSCRKRIGFPVVLLPPDEKVYHEEFGDKAVLCAPYGTAENIWKHLEELKALREEKENEEGEGKTIRILVGHNAHPFNRHRMVLDMLLRFNMEDIRLCMPLSYGNDGAERIADYPRMVEEYAKILFPQKVSVQKKLMTKWDYDRYLSGIDIGIFGAPRQNALGNIIRLIYMGKKVFLSSDNPLYPFLKEKGVPVFDMDLLKTISFEEFAAPVESEEGKDWVVDYFSMDSAARRWREVFDHVEGVDL